MQDSLKAELSTLKFACPTCQKVVLWNDDFPYRPFCSDRCRLIDLGDWASESHRIAGDNLDINSEDDHKF